MVAQPAGVLPSGEAVVVVEFVLQGRECRLGDGIVPAHPGCTHGLADAVAGAPGTHFAGGVLGAAVTMENRILGQVSAVPAIASAPVTREARM